MLSEIAAAGRAPIIEEAVLDEPIITTDLTPLTPPETPQSQLDDSAKEADEQI